MGTQQTQLTPTERREIPDHLVPISAIKLGGRGVDGGTAWWLARYQLLGWWWATAFVCTSCLSWVYFPLSLVVLFRVFFPYNFLKLLFNY